MAESVGVGDCDGLSIELHAEIPPDAAEPDRLAIAIRIPFDVLRTLLPPATGEPQ
jgi:hypothetical protein